MKNELKKMYVEKTETKLENKESPQIDFQFKALWTQNNLKLHELFAHINKMVEYVNLNISKNAIKLTNIDSSHVSLVDLTLDRSDFYEFDFYCESKVDNVDLSIELKPLVQALKNFNKKSDEIKLSISSTNEYLTIESNGTILNVNLPTIEIDLIPVPKLEFNNEILVKTEKIQEILAISKNAQIDYVELTNNGSTFSMLGSNDKMKFQKEIEIEEFFTMKYNNQSVMYSQEYLKEIFNYAKNSTLKKQLDETTIEFSEYMPLKVTFKLEDLENSYLIYFVAPRVDDEDEDY